MNIFHCVFYHLTNLCKTSKILHVLLWFYALSYELRLALMFLFYYCIIILQASDMGEDNAGIIQLFIVKV